MNDIATLVIVPPAQVFDFDAGGGQASLRLLNLGLKSSMSEQKWARMVEQNLHVTGQKGTLVLVAVK